MQQTNVIEYKCPCCNAGLIFQGNEQKLKCEYCDNSFELDTVKAFNEDNTQQTEPTIEWDEDSHTQWSEEEQKTIRSFQCPSCGGEILTDETTAASFCPYCDNPTVMPGQFQNAYRPDGLIPFKTSREDAQNAFLKLCKGKPLLPKFFTSEQQLEKITGMYVPFWLYDCSGEFQGNFKATRIHRWSDSCYHYTKTDHFLLKREASAAFEGIPMDGSSKMDDTFMESIEPYDYSDIREFDTAYLTGYLADKYDVESSSGEERIRERVDAALYEQIQTSLLGYATALPTVRNINIKHSKARNILFPVWILNTRYNGKIYTFAMNGQTGKMTGSFPVCPKRTAGWFAGICAAVTLVSYAFQFLLV